MSTDSDEHQSELFTRKVSWGNHAIPRPLNFYIGLNKVGRASTAALINSHGGEISSHPVSGKNPSISLVDPQSKPATRSEPVYSIHYIKDCIDAEQLLNVDEYRIPRCDEPLNNSKATSAKIALSASRGPHFKVHKVLKVQPRASRDRKPRASRNRKPRPRVSPLHTSSALKNLRDEEQESDDDIQPKSREARAPARNNISSNVARRSYRLRSRDGLKDTYPETKHEGEQHTGVKHANNAKRDGTNPSKAEVPPNAPAYIRLQTHHKGDAMHTQSESSGDIRHKIESQDGSPNNNYPNPSSKAQHVPNQDPESLTPNEYETASDVLHDGVDGSEPSTKLQSIAASKTWQDQFRPPRAWTISEETLVIKVCKASRRRLLAQVGHDENLFSMEHWEHLVNANSLPADRSVEEWRQKAVELYQSHVNEKVDDMVVSNIEKKFSTKKRNNLEPPEVIQNEDEEEDEGEYEIKQVYPRPGQGRKRREVQHLRQERPKDYCESKLKRQRERMRAKIRKRVRSLSLETRMSQRRVFQVLRDHSGNVKKALVILSREYEVGKKG